MSSKKQISDIHLLEKALGLRFNNIALLEQALTHRSFSANNNERLEFLGDALLESWTSCKLFMIYPQANEGDLTRLRAAIVKESSLVLVANSLNLGDYLRLGLGELKTGGARRKSILADAVEAVLAAVYLDCGPELSYQLFERLFEQLIADNTNPEALKDPKTRLQEYLQANNLALPQYQLEDETGPDHAKEFTVRVISGQWQAQARASSRKKAEMIAAEKMLDIYLGNS